MITKCSPPILKFIRGVIMKQLGLVIFCAVVIPAFYLFFVLVLSLDIILGGS